MAPLRGAPFEALLPEKLAQTTRARPGRSLLLLPRPRPCARSVLIKRFLPIRRFLLAWSSCAQPKLERQLSSLTGGATQVRIEG